MHINKFQCKRRVRQLTWMLYSIFVVTKYEGPQCHFFCTFFSFMNRWIFICDIKIFYVRKSFEFTKIQWCTVLCVMNAKQFEWTAVFRSAEFIYTLSSTSNKWKQTQSESETWTTVRNPMVIYNWLSRRFHQHFAFGFVEFQLNTYIFIYNIWWTIVFHHTPVPPHKNDGVLPFEHGQCSNGG